MTSNFKSERMQFPDLYFRQVSRPAQESGCDVKRCPKSEFLQHRRRPQQVSFTSVIKGNANAFPAERSNRLPDAYASPFFLREVSYLLTEFSMRNDIAGIAWLFLTRFSPGDSQFVVHQENDALFCHPESWSVATRQLLKSLQYETQPVPDFRHRISPLKVVVKRSRCRCQNGEERLESAGICPGISCRRSTPNRQQMAEVTQKPAARHSGTEL